MNWLLGKLITIASISVLGASLAACGTPAPTGARAALPMKATITLDPHVGEKFAPAPVGAKAGLSAQQAFARYMKVDNSRYHNSAIPSGTAIHIGLFTLPIGPAGPDGSEIYTAHNELAYGYSWHSCPVSMNPGNQKVPPNPCREWLFLDANTGHQIDETWQMKA